MELLPLLLLIPMTLAGLALLTHSLGTLQRLRQDGGAWSARKAVGGLGHAALLLFGAGLAIESLRPLLPETTGLLPRVVLVVLAAGGALLVGRGLRPRAHDPAAGR